MYIYKETKKALNMTDEMRNKSIACNGLNLFDTEEKRNAVYNYVDQYVDLRNARDYDNLKMLDKTTLKALFGDFDEIDVTVWMHDDDDSFVDNSSFVVGINQELTSNYLDCINYTCQPDWDFIIWQGKLKDLPRRFWGGYSPLAVWLQEDDYLDCDHFLEVMGYEWNDEDCDKYMDPLFEKREWAVLYGMSESKNSAS